MTASGGSRLGAAALGAPLRGVVLHGDAATQLRRIPTGSIDMVLTSPPYFRLRDYQTPGQLGLENTIGDWVNQLAAVARELHRVLVPTGSLWLNLGDTYSTRPGQGAPRRSLLLGPERLALTLLNDGWVLRNKLIWAKTNPMPTSATDRLACTWEVVYLLTTGAGYYFDLDAIRQPHRSRPPRHRDHTRPRQREAWRGPNGDDDAGLAALKAAGRVGHPLGKNPGDVWSLASSNYRGAHHATFPTRLARRAIQAGCPEQRCTACRQPWRRGRLRALGGTAVRASLAPSCGCRAGREPGLVLDPFFGAGSTGVAAEELQRDWCGIELNPRFARLAERRIHAARASPPASA